MHKTYISTFSFFRHFILIHILIININIHTIIHKHTLILIHFHFPELLFCVIFHSLPTTKTTFTRTHTLSLALTTNTLTHIHSFLTTFALSLIHKKKTHTKHMRPKTLDQHHKANLISVFFVEKWLLRNKTI